MLNRIVRHPLALLAVALLLGSPVRGAEPAPWIVSFSKPAAGDMQILFHGNQGPFRIQMRSSLDAAAPWVDLPTALVTQVQPGTFLGWIPSPIDPVDLGFYRVVSEDEVIAELDGWTVRLAVSAPANGSHFVAGERPVVTVTILDTLAQGLRRTDFSTLALYLHGPQDPQRTVTAVKLLNATADRTKTPHHFIDLRTQADVQVHGTVLTYTLQPVTDEAPGTYTASLRAVRGSDALQQIMRFADLQIGTATVETRVTSSAKCAACHEGAVSGKMYLHHIDPRGTSLGSWSLDYDPERSCSACHNREGYAAFRDAAAPGGRVPDPYVLRAHGVHRGEGLRSAFNTNSVNGNFLDYLHVKFPADVRNCTACHVDDRWKTEPSRLACGSCHDNIWFGPSAARPAGMLSHSGGPQTTDEVCAACHAPDPYQGEFIQSISETHRVAPPAFKQAVTLALTPPANGKFYVAGEAPRVIIKVTDALTGQALHPTNLVEPLISTNVQPHEYRRAMLLVAGPRARTVPVLTPAATNTTSSYAQNDFRVRVNPANEDRRVTRTADAVHYQLDAIGDLTPGTYTVYVEVGPQQAPNATAYLNFQVGTANVEPQVAAGCLDCHGDTRIHASSRAVPMIADVCKVCHDDKHQLAGRTAWTSGQHGFGTSPLSRRIHGVHFGNYLERPDLNTRGIEKIIFPQDVRNCTKCHDDPRSLTWTQKPSRLACLSCHDGVDAGAHGTLMTFDPTPADPWSGDEIESCEVCHGAKSTLSPAKVHAIANPYVPPYPRALREP